MNAVAVPEGMTTTSTLVPEKQKVLGLGKRGDASAAARKNKKAPVRIASRVVDDDDDSACDDVQHGPPPPLPSTSYPADPTLETCCHEPPPIALNPLNEFLFWGEKFTRLPIPPTNDIVLIQRTVLQELGFPDANADTLAKRFRDARMPRRAAWFARLRPLSWRLYSLASELALPGMFRYLDARVRFFDGVVEEALRAGVDQHLFLAAGYDTRAVRMATSEAAVALEASKRRKGEEAAAEAAERGARGGGGGATATVTLAGGGGGGARFGDSAKVLLSSRSTAKGNDDDNDASKPSTSSSPSPSSPSSSSPPPSSSSSSSFAPRFFEVDLPRVSAAKKKLVDQVLPDSNRWPRPAFVGADLLDARGTLDALARAGFDGSASRPCLATLEGILMYLPPKNARAILRTVSTLLTPGSLLAFDFVVEECFATGGLGRRRDGGGGKKCDDDGGNASPSRSSSSVTISIPSPSSDSSSSSRSSDSSARSSSSAPPSASASSASPSSAAPSPSPPSSLLSSYLSGLRAKLFPAYPTYGLVASSVAHHGEPFLSGFDHEPEAHAALAASLGFRVRRLLDAPAVVETFFEGKKCGGPVSDYMAMALWEKL